MLDPGACFGTPLFLLRDIFAVLWYDIFVKSEKGSASMKLKDGFLLRQVAGQNVVLPVGGDLDMNMMITLNDTGAFLWERLQSETDEETLVAALLGDYDVDEATARMAVSTFVEKLRSHGFLEQ